MSKGGRTFKVEPNLIIEQISNNKSVIFKDARPVGPRHDVYRTISEKLEGKISPSAIYTFIKQNKRAKEMYREWGLQEEAEDGMEDVLEELTSFPTELSEGVQPYSPPSENEEENCNIFQITLSVEEWKEIAPKEYAYKKKSVMNTYKEYKGLTPHAWTHIINEHFWLITKLPCCIVYKRANISENGQYYVRLEGFCKDCEGKFVGTMSLPPPEDQRAVFNCSYTSKKPCNKDTSKRMLKGTAKEKVLDLMMKGKKSALAIRLQEANKVMVHGDSEPSHLPSLNALRCAKYKAQEEENLDKDVFSALSIAKFTTPFKECIKDVGFNKFFVKYWTPSQLNSYREFTSRRNSGVFVLDATGNIVKKIRRPFGNKSSGIFLYQAKVFDDITGLEFPVCQMLSERHDNMAIYSWLYDWVNQGAPIPSQCVSDRSVAMLSGVVKAFTKNKSLSEYLMNCYNVLFYDRMEDLPECFVRCDIAHLIKNITSWKPLKRLTHNVRIFYVHSIAELLKASSVAQAKTIIAALCQLASSTTVGKKLVNGIPSCDDIPAETARKLLRDIISGSTQEEDIYDFESNEVVEVPEILECREDIDTQITCNNPFKDWGAEIRLTNDQSTGPKGEYDSAFFCPQLINNILDLVNDLPLVTGVMISKFGFGQETATSAKIETTFNVIKNVIFSDKKLPMRADQFVTSHIMAIEGELKLFASKSVMQQTSSSATEDDHQNPDYLLCNPFEVASNKVDVDEDETMSTSDHCQSCEVGKNEFSTFCLNCKLLIHTNIDTCCQPVSGIDHQGQFICFECYKKVPEENYIRENWKGEGYSPQKKQPSSGKRPIVKQFDLHNGTLKKKRNMKSYLEKLPELANMDTSGKTVTEVSILKNGNRASELKPLTNKLFPESKVTVTNTCAFDSLTQILACAYNDTTSKCLVDIFNTIKSDSVSYMFLEICRDLATKPVSHVTYKKRLDLLINSYKDNVDHMPGGIVSLHTESTAADVVGRFLKDIPAFFDVHECSTSYCIQNKRRPKPILQIAIPSSGIGSIQEWLGKILQEEESVCTACGGTKRLHVEVSHKWLFLEVFDITNNNDSDVLEETEVVPDNIPPSITISDNIFHLRGFIGFSGSRRSFKNIGHYTAKVRRVNGCWEEYDDTKSKKQPINRTKKTPCQVLVYTK